MSNQYYIPPSPIDYDKYSKNYLMLNDAHHTTNSVPLALKNSEINEATSQPLLIENNPPSQKLLTNKTYKKQSTPYKPPRIIFGKTKDDLMKVPIKDLRLLFKEDVPTISQSALQKITK